jgi:hypothetical protein
MSFLRNTDVKKHLGRAKPRLVSNPAKPNNEAMARPSTRLDEGRVRQPEAKVSSTNSKTV